MVGTNGGDDGDDDCRQQERSPRLARLAEGYDDLHTPRNAYSPTASKEADDLFPNDAYGGALWTSTAEEDGAAQREEEDAAAFFGSSFTVNADSIRSTTA